MNARVALNLIAKKIVICYNNRYEYKENAC